MSLDVSSYRHSPSVPDGPSDEAVAALRQAQQDFRRVVKSFDERPPTFDAFEKRQKQQKSSLETEEDMARLQLRNEVMEFRKLMEGVPRGNFSPSMNDIYNGYEQMGTLPFNSFDPSMMGMGMNMNMGMDLGMNGDSGQMAGFLLQALQNPGQNPQLENMLRQASGQSFSMF